jgi:hypothetical protein
MALATGVPIIPLGIHVDEGDVIRLSGKYEGEQRSMLWQISGKCHLRFGALWNPSPNQPNLHLQVDELMDRIYALVAQTRRERSCESLTLLNPILR